MGVGGKGALDHAGDELPGEELVGTVAETGDGGARLNEAEVGGGLGGVEVGMLNADDAVEFGDWEAVHCGDSEVACETDPVLACSVVSVIEGDVGGSILVLQDHHHELGLFDVVGQTSPQIDDEVAPRPAHRPHHVKIRYRAGV